MQVKICRICHKEKSLDSFHKRKKSKDGHNSICAICQNEYNTDIKRRPETVIKSKQYNRERYLRRVELELQQSFKRIPNRIENLKFEQKPTYNKLTNWHIYDGYGNQIGKLSKEDNGPIYFRSGVLRSLNESEIEQIHQFMLDNGSRSSL